MELIEELERLLSEKENLLISLPSHWFGNPGPTTTASPLRPGHHPGELLNELTQRFRKVYLLRQPVLPVSAVRQVNGSGPTAVPVSADAGQAPSVPKRREVYYLLALCSNRDLEVPAGSSLWKVVDPALPEGLEEWASTDPLLAAATQAVDQRPAPAESVDWPLPARSLPPAPAADTAQTAGATPPVPGTGKPDGTPREFAGLRLVVQRLIAEKNACRAELLSLRQNAETQARNLKAKTEVFTRRTAEFRDLLVDGRDLLLRNADKILVDVSAELKTAQDYAADLENQVRDLQGKQATAENELTELAQQIRALNSEEDDTWQEIAQMKRAVERAAQEQQTVHQEVNRLETLVQERTGERDTLQEQVNRLTEVQKEQKSRLQELEPYVLELEGRIQQAGSGQERVAELEAYAADLERQTQVNANERRSVEQGAAGLTQSAEGFAVQITPTSSREAELREMLLDAQDQLLRRDQEIQEYLAQALPKIPVFPATTTPQSNGFLGRAPEVGIPDRQAGPVIRGPIASPRFGDLKPEALPSQSLESLRQVVNRVLPPGVHVVVVSGGNEDLLQLDGRPGCHFPPAENRRPTGRYPTDGPTAIAQLEALRAQGADFLLIPVDARGWLDQHPEFREYLDAQCVGLVCQEGPCTIFDLHSKPTLEEHQQRRQWLRQVREVVRRLPPQAAVAVISEGDPELLQLEGRRTWHFPQTEAGEYAGYPPSSAAAIASLQWLRGQGAEYLLVPGPALWWLDHFAEFRQFLEQHGGEVVCQEDPCVILDLHRVPGAESILPPDDSPVAKLQRVVKQFLPAPAVGGLKHYYWNILEYLERSVGLIVRREGAQVIFDMPPTIKEHQVYRLLVPQIRKALDRLPDPAVAGLKFGYLGAKKFLERYLGVVVRRGEDEFFPEPEDLDLVAQIQRAAARVLPPWARVAVISEGDPRLLHLADRKVSHFPSTPDGAYTGKPVDSDAAITQLEALRVRGFDCLVVPKTTLGWLETYPEFHHFLDDQCLGLVCREDACWIYDLHDRPTPEELRSREELIGRVRAVVDQRLPLRATVLVLNEGNPDLLQLAGRTAWPFPQDAAGNYAGYPPSAEAAIANLETLQARGAEFLVCPSTTSQMVSYYPAFGEYLNRRCQGLMCEEPSCIIFDLRAKEGAAWPPDPEIAGRIRAVVQRVLPPNAKVVVLSQGQDDLVRLAGRTAWHFPRTPEGAYAGEPATSAEAVTHLEELRTQGAEFLLVPAPAFDWLTHYPEFGQHVQGRYPEVTHEEGVCLILALRPVSEEERRQHQELVRLTRDLVDRRVPPQATVLVITQGDADLLQLAGRTAWHFPRTPDGTYAGFPADNDAIITHLEALRAQGAEYLVVPPTSLWWLDHFREFRLHLETPYRLVTQQVLDPTHGVCNIYALQPFRKREATERAFGVNLAGNFNSEKGVGEAVRSVIRGLEAVQIPYVLNNWVDYNAVNWDNSYSAFTPENPYRINLIQANAVAVPGFVAQQGETYFHDHYNIGYWFWELSQFPKEWEASLQYFDELWAGSTFVLDALARFAHVPVIRVPLSVPEQLPTLPVDRAHFGLPPQTFVFLFVFDFHSVLERKHPRGLLEAFRKAFSDKDDVLLVLKGAHASPGEVEALEALAAGARVRVIDQVMTREEVNTLLRLSDCYVSLHRSEGFGLTLLEAMSLEKPVIATGYSGNMDFMTTANSFLVKYTLKEIERDYGPYRKGWVWADPDLDHAAELMRSAYDNRAAAREAGRRARQDVLRQLHPQVVGGLMKERLLKIDKS